MSQPSPGFLGQCPCAFSHFILSPGDFQALLSLWLQKTWWIRGLSPQRQSYVFSCLLDFSTWITHSSVVKTDLTILKNLFTLQYFCISLGRAFVPVTEGGNFRIISGTPKYSFMISLLFSRGSWWRLWATHPLYQFAQCSEDRKIESEKILLNKCLLIGPMYSFFRVFM